jgi:hypothetical protein
MNLLGDGVIDRFLVDTGRTTQTSSSGRPIQPGHSDAKAQTLDAESNFTAYRISNSTLRDAPAIWLPSTWLRRTSPR